MSTDYTMLIGGEFVAGDKGTSTIINPATEEPVGEAPEASVEQSHQAAAAARDAFEGWWATPATEKARLLDALADRLEAERERLVPLIIDETGATAAVGSQMQVPVAIDRFRYYAKAALRSHDIAVAPQQTKTTPLAAGGMLNAVVQRQPVGRGRVHHAVQLPARQHGRQDRPGARRRVHGRDEARPPGPAGDPRTGHDHARGRLPARRRQRRHLVRRRSGRGAERVARRRHGELHRLDGRRRADLLPPAAPTMKRLLLELGGKGAALILDDADVGDAVKALVSVWGFHSGQICTAPTRAVVHRSRYDDVVARPQRRPPVSSRSARPPSSTRSSDR